MFEFCHPSATQHVTFADNAIAFHSQLHLDLAECPDVDILDPYRSPATLKAMSAFYRRFFNDSRERVAVFGINPGRFGGGLTGISFTDPVALREHCGIDSDLGDRVELSSDFVYRSIMAFGGVQEFFNSFYLSALCPLGFVRAGINYNFYDDADLARATRPFIVESLRRQLGFPLRRDVALCLGRGKLHDVFSRINEEHGFFERIEALDHPRFIMQYRRKKLDDYVAQYVSLFRACSFAARA